jgi:succinoglycan biosynthesis protein ExoA
MVLQQYFQYGFWKVAVIRKHRLPGSWRHMVPVLFVLAHLLLIAASVAGLALGSPRWAVTCASLWLAMCGCYALANFSASAAAASTAGWDIFPYLPAAFATYHLSWGLGFVVGLFRSLPKASLAVSVSLDSHFTKLTR